MKRRTFLASLGLLLAAVLLPLSAQSPTITQSAEYPWRIQCDFTYVNGTLTSAPIVQFYRSDVASNGTVIAQPSSTPSSLTVDLVQKASSTVTVNGQTYTYGQAIEIVTALLAQERATQLAAH